MTQGHHSVDLMVERALNHLGKYNKYKAIILLTKKQKKKQSNTKLRSHFVPLHTRNFKT